MIQAILFVASLIAGAIASVAGFGIGSILTPAFGFVVETKLAVAAVSIPHFFGTLVRFWRLRAHVDRRVLWSFGVTSAAGGLVGALLNARAGSPVLTVVGVLLLFAGFMGVTGLARRMVFHGPLAWGAGGVSGLFGGLVGNQGGIRSAALLGTLFGTKLLHRIPERLFHRIVGALVFALGVYMLGRGFGWWR